MMIDPLEMRGEAKTVTIKEIEMMIGEVEMMNGEVEIMMIEEARIMMIEEAKIMMIKEAGTITTEKETEITMKQKIGTKRDLLVQVVRGGGVEPRRREGGGVHLQSINLQREGADQERGRGSNIIHLVREIGAVADLVSDQGDRSAWNRTVNKNFFHTTFNFLLIIYIHTSY